MQLNIKKLHKSALLPTRGASGDAGLDLYACESVTFSPGAQATVATGIAVEIPHGCVGLIWDKSSISFQKGLKVLGGVIDAGYRGEILISLYNTTNTVQTIEVGKKAAQMIIQKFEEYDMVEVEVLGDTERGVGGFGSTGA
jgi:dUTP pyrophosphatase